MEAYGKKDTFDPRFIPGQLYNRDDFITMLEMIKATSGPLNPEIAATTDRFIASAQTADEVAMFGFDEEGHLIRGLQLDVAINNNQYIQ